MNREEIDYWLKLFSNNNQSFMSKDGKKITLFKVFQELKELQQENKKLKEVIDKSIKLIEDTYYSKNTTDIDSIVLSNNKLLKIREILKEVNK